MSSGADEAPVTQHTVTDEDKKLVFSFVQYLLTVSTSNAEQVNTVVNLLGEMFGVDPAGVGGSHDPDVDLFEAFRRALGEREKSRNSHQDEKFNSFLELLTKKGYFTGAEPGSEEYNSRLEKARQKFEKRNNPYDGMTAEEIKNKGNELMGVTKYKEAVAAYTKAIEMEPENHVFFANRAAAHTHLKDYCSAIIDCERAISISPTYAKAYSRLGTSLFYQENYKRAVDAFSKACELDPTNERYKEDLKQAEDKAKQSISTSEGAGGMGGLPFGPGGMPDFSQVAKMMSNPQFIEATTRMMENPQFSQLIANMASRFGEAGATPDMANLLGGGGMGAPAENEDGTLTTPFGRVDRDALERLRREEVENNPRFAAIMEDVQRNGFSAFQKYIGDPEVMNLMLKFQSAVFGGGSGGNSPS
uniref:Uncharacterized protein n=1 Tax=Trypanosoma congolense (strain IL3000) TaxID=1068625 RepID=G0UNX8_TRYCI|nr:conserved hypothetical protein [Trypanosoma congolense IL3000]